MMAVKNFKKRVVILTLGLTFLLSANFVSAQVTSTVDFQALIVQLQAQVKLLQTQILELKSQLDVAKKESAVIREEFKITKEEVKEIKEEIKLTKFLQRGAQGEEVTKLQEFLKQFPDIYPEGLVTGYFGALTENAIKKLQEKHGIETVGNVGPKTLAKINELFAEGAGESRVKPAATSAEIPLPVFTATTTVSTTTFLNVVATTTAVAVAATTSATAPAATPAPAGPVTGGAAAAPVSPVSSPTPSPTPSPAGIVFEYVPTIRILSPTSETTYTTSSSTVVLIASITDDKALATSTVFWRNLAILGTAKNYTFTVTGNIWETSPISLVPGVNNIVINAEDFQQPQPGVGAGGVFVTYNPPPPPPVPVISNLQATVAENSAVVSWNTDRSTDSLVYYALSSLASASYAPIKVGPGAITTNHSVTISGLSSGITYYYYVVSKDNAGLTATSSDTLAEKSFTTLVPMTPPLGYWKFDGNGNNEIAGGAAAVIVGNAAFNASGGKYGGYAYLPANGDSLRISHNSIFNLPDSFTIEFWFRQRSDQSFAQDLVSKGTPINNYNFRVYRQLWNQYNFGPLIAGYTSAATGYWTPVSNPNQLAHNVWHHVAFIKNPTQRAYYLDGAWVHSASDSPPARTYTDDIIIGGTAVDTDIDNLKIYNRVLNPSEISQSYNSSTGDLGLKERLASIAAAISRLSEEIKKLFRK